MYYICHLDNFINVELILDESFEIDQKKKEGKTDVIQLNYMGSGSLIMIASEERTVEVLANMTQGSKYTITSENINSLCRRILIIWPNGPDFYELCRDLNAGKAKSMIGYGMSLAFMGGSLIALLAEKIDTLFSLILLGIGATSAWYLNKRAGIKDIFLWLIKEKKIIVPRAYLVEASRQEAKKRNIPIIDLSKEDATEVDEKFLKNLIYVMKHHNFAGKSKTYVARGDAVVVEDLKED